MARPKKKSTKKNNASKTQSRVAKVVESRSKTIGDVRLKCLSIADTAFEAFESDKDIRLALVSLAGFKTAIAATKTQIQHQKVTGTAKVIPFCQE